MANYFGMIKYKMLNFLELCLILYKSKIYFLYYGLLTLFGLFFTSLRLKSKIENDTTNLPKKNHIMFSSIIQNGIPKSRIFWYEKGTKHPHSAAT